MGARIVCAAVVAFSVFLLGGCSRSHSFQPGGRDSDSKPGFSLHVWNESFLGGEPAGKFEIAQASTAAGETIEVRVSNARRLKALYFDLSYDPSLYHPLAVEPTGAMAAPDGLLRLSHLTERGKVYFGQILIRPQDQTGLTGDAVLASVRFAQGEATPEFLSAVADRSAAPSQAAASAGPFVMWDRTESEVTWLFGGPGDYDQNGETNIADITPIAMSYLDHGYFQPLSSHAVIDGDGSGEINIADITPIALNFMKRVDGYNLYLTSTPGGASSSLRTPSIAGLTPYASQLAFGGDTMNNAKVMKFSIAGMNNTVFGGKPVALSVTNGLLSILLDGAQAYVQVAPYDGANEGAPSNVLGGDPALAPHVEVTPAIPGAGTMGDPYRIDLASTYQLKLFDSAHVDVTSSTNGTGRIVSMSIPGEAAPSSLRNTSSNHRETPLAAISFGSDGGGGDVYIFQTPQTSPYLVMGVFNVGVSFPQADPVGAPGPVYFQYVQPGANIPPVMKFTATPPQPYVGQPVAFDATASTDSDGTITQYQFDFVGTKTFVAPDGATNAQGTANYTYTDSGAHTIFIQGVDNGYGAYPPAVTGMKVPIVVLDNAPPIAFFSWLPAQPYAGAPVTLDASGSTDADGTIAEYDWDYESDGTVDQVSPSPVQQVAFSPGYARDVTLIVVDNNGAVSSVKNSIIILVNELPQAFAYATPNPVHAKEATMFDASASVDADGTIALYSWDFDGDAVYDLDTAGATTPHAYDAPGTFAVNVRVTDDKGATDSCSFNLDVLPERSWHGNLVDGGGAKDVGQYASLAEVNGQPAIACFDAANTNLLYYRSTDGGQTWAAPVLVANTPAVQDGKWPSLLAPAGAPPMIAYYDVTNCDVMFVCATDNDGAVWGTGFTVDGATSSVGKGLSAAIVNGNPAITYYGLTEVNFIRATDANGTAWGTPVMIGFGAIDPNAITRLKADASFPPIAIFKTGTNLNYSEAQDANGAAWNTYVLDSNDALVAYDVILLGGVPTATYADSATGELKAEQPVDPGHADWSAFAAPLSAWVDASGSVSVPTLTQGDVFYGEYLLTFAGITNAGWTVSNPAFSNVVTNTIPGTTGLGAGGLSAAAVGGTVAFAAYDPAAKSLWYYVWK